MKYLITGAILFGIGLFGALSRRNIIGILISLELMLNSVILNFVFFSRNLADLSGQIFALFIMVIAAGEVAVGLAIIISFYHGAKKIDMEGISLMKW